MIYQVFSVAPSGPIKCSGVHTVNLDGHIARTLKRHPDWALIVNGEVRHPGTLDKYQIAAAHMRIMQLPRISKDTTPKQAKAST